MKVTITFETEKDKFWAKDKLSLSRYYRGWIKEWLNVTDNDFQKLKVKIEH